MSRIGGYKFPNDMNYDKWGLIIFKADNLSIIQYNLNFSKKIITLFMLICTHLYLYLLRNIVGVKEAILA
jgi:hypothetical protein